MPNTSGWALSYPTTNDFPNGPAQIQDLAGDADSALTQVYGGASNRPRQILNGLSPGGVSVLANGSGTILTTNITTTLPCVLLLESNVDCYNASASSVAGYMQLYIGATKVNQIRFHFHTHAGWLTPSGSGRLYLPAGATTNVTVHMTNDPDSANAYTPFDCSWQLTELPAL